MLRSAEDDLGLRHTGIYQIPCKCGKSYKGQTGDHLQQPETYGLMQRILVSGHNVFFESTTVIAKVDHF